MSNMSYCRFQNTAIDFSDCDDTIKDMLDECGDATQLSDAELGAAQILVSTAVELVTMLLGEANTDLDDPAAVRKMCDKLAIINRNLPRS